MSNSELSDLSEIPIQNLSLNLNLDLSDLTEAKKAVGFNQTKKAVKSGRAKKIFAAHDADDKFLAGIKRLCEECNAEINLSASMAQLKQACGIEVDCAVCAVLK